MYLEEIIQGFFIILIYQQAYLLFFCGIFIFIKDKKSLISKALLYLSGSFSLWVILDLITWVSFSSINIMSAWALTTIFEGIIYISSLYFLYVFINKKDLPIFQKIIIGILFLPILIFAPTTYNVSSFDYINCWSNTGVLLDYLHIFETIMCLWILIISITAIIKSKTDEKKQIILVFFGIFLFLLSFLTTAYISQYLTDKGIASGYNVESYGLFGMAIFIAFLSDLIVKFKKFNIKLIGAQALVWALVILIGSQLLYLNNSSLAVKILTVITLIIATILGLLLVRGVKREIALREELQVANAGQINLIHIMNHQIKGYLGVNKNIFAELLTDDYCCMPESALPLVQKGLEESDAGVKYVTDILRGASAENGTLPYDMKQMNFKEILSEVAKKEKEIAEKKGLAFDLKINDGKYEMTGDSMQLGEAIRNLIDNSIFYTPKGNIWISLANKAGKIFLVVKDTGVGVREEDKSKLFKAGGVGKDSLKINIRSSGYGLAFVKGVVEAHKGKVWFESEGEGKGSTFFVELPKK